MLAVYFAWCFVGGMLLVAVHSGWDHSNPDLVPGIWISFGVLAVVVGFPGGRLYQIGAGIAKPIRHKRSL